MVSKCGLLTASFVSLVSNTLVSGAQEEAKQLSEVFGNWTVSCTRAENTSKKSCQMSQELLQADNNQRVLVVALQAVPNSLDLEATIIAPFGLFLPKGLTINVEGEKTITSSFQTCMPIGCISKINVNNSLSLAFSAGDKITFGMNAYSGDSFEINLPLEGFFEASERLMTLYIQNNTE